MKIIYLAIFSLFMNVNALAAEIISQNIDVIERSKNWSTEALINTTSNSQAMTFGPSIFYNLNTFNQMGFRVLAPIGEGEVGTSSLGLIYRLHLGENVTRLFMEGSLSLNSYHYNFFGLDKAHIGGSAGTNIGVIHHLNSDISFGGISGFEWARTRFGDNYAYESSDDLYAYLRIGLFGSIHF